MSEVKECFECSCCSPEHVMKFTLFEDMDNELLAHIFLQPEPLPKRLWTALKYVFGYKCQYGHFDEFVVRPEDADKFISLFQRYKAGARRGRNKAQKRRPLSMYVK